MRAIKLGFLATAVVMFTASCTNDVLENRVSELERRVAQLENGGVTARPAATPLNTTQVSNPTPVVEEKPEGPIPSFQFASESYDFGAVTEGEMVDYTFTFTNVGEAPLIIQSATASCGCTVPSYSREPVPVGGTGEIAVQFNSKNKKGNQAPTVTVTANTYPKVTKLRLKGTVNPAQ
jgi:hypothetical protein